MRFSLYAGDVFLMSASEKSKLLDATTSQLRRWLDEMANRATVVGSTGEVELRLYDNGKKVATRLFVPAMGRLHGWKHEAV